MYVSAPTKKHLLFLYALTLATLGSAGIAAAQVFTYTTNFDSLTPGSIVGQDGWTDPSNDEGGFTENVVAGAGLNGSQALQLSGNSDNVENTESPVFPAVGESHTVYNTPIASNTFNESFYFRTVSTTEDPNLYISNSLSAPASIRDTWLGLYDDTTVGDPTYGDLIFGAYATQADGTFAANPTISAVLQWGQWYQVEVHAVFNDGPNNDQITYTVLTANGSVVLPATTIGSWESYYSTPANNAEGAPGPEALTDTTFGLGGGQGIYVDNFSESVGTPEPSTWAMIATGFGLLLFYRKRHSRN
jgi:hypothetical protein